MILARLQTLNWAVVPYAWHRPLEKFLSHGRVPSDAFLQAVLCGSLPGVLKHRVQRQAISSMAKFLDEIPPQCWGSAQKVLEWERIGGMAGIQRQLERGLRYG